MNYDPGAPATRQHLAHVRKTVAEQQETIAELQFKLKEIHETNDVLWEMLAELKQQLATWASQFPRFDGDQ